MTSYTVTAKDKPLEVAGELGKLMLIVALAEHGTCPAAARHLGIPTHIPVGKARMYWEKRYGVQLFDITRRPNRLTPVGELFIERAVKIIKDWRAMHRSMTKVADTEEAKAPQRRTVLAMPQWMFDPQTQQVILDAFAKEPGKYGNPYFYMKTAVTEFEILPLLDRGKPTVYVTTEVLWGDKANNHYTGVLFTEQWFAYRSVESKESVSTPYKRVIVPYGYCGRKTQLEASSNVEGVYPQCERVSGIKNPIQTVYAIAGSQAIGYIPARYKLAGMERITEIQPIEVEYRVYTSRGVV